MTKAVSLLQFILWFPEGDEPASSAAPSPTGSVAFLCGRYDTCFTRMSEFQRQKFRRDPPVESNLPLNL